MALSIVHDPGKAGIAATIDVVAVHGLGGDAFTTWTHPKSKKFWLRDFLPQQLPDARIMTFGYNADAAFGQSVATVVDHAKSLLAGLIDKRDEPEETDRPLIFLAHSLGGIVVKQALFEARLESRYGALKNATRGIVFFGTPHRGSGKAVYGKVLANVARALAHQPPARLLSALQTNSDVLSGLTTNFRHQLPDYEVCSFYEQRPMKGFSSLIVEKHSALLEVNHEEQIPVDADHRAMCKFETAEDDTYEKVYKRIKRMKNSSRRTTETEPVSSNKHFEVDNLLSSTFTGRGEDLHRLTLALSVRPPEHDQMNQRRFVLYGLGGVGKSQICLKFIHDERNRYWGIFWIDATTHQSILHSFSRLARALQVEENVESTKRQLTNSHNPWLLVFDNADDPNISLAPYFPAGNRGDVIITSRNPQCQNYNTAGSIEIKQLSPQDGLVLLAKNAYGTTTIPAPDTVEAGEAVVKALGGLALAIVHAGAYIREQSCSLSDYLALYKEQKQQLLQYQPKHLSTEYLYSVAATWQISVDQIKTRNDTVSYQTLRLLDLLGFYHYDKIPLKMFYNVWERVQNEEHAEYLPWYETIGQPFRDYQQAVRASASVLASFSLVTRVGHEFLSLHPLVHEWCQDRIPDEQQRQISWSSAVTLLDWSVNWQFASEDYTFRRSLVSHVHTLLNAVEQQRQLGEQEKMRRWGTLALILRENWWTKDAILLLEEAVDLYKSNMGMDNLDTLGSMDNLASCYAEAGRQEEALTLTIELVDLYRDKLGLGHPDTVRLMHNLANCYAEAGQQEKALALTIEVVDLYKSKLGPDHPHTLGSMHNLAICYTEARRQEEALALSIEVVDLRRDKLGLDHPDTLRSMHNLAICYAGTGQQEKALALSIEVVHISRDKLGLDHPETLRSMHNLALRYEEVGRQEEAILLMTEVVDLHRDKLGLDHPETLRSMHNLAFYYKKAGRQEEAISLMTEVVDLRREKLGPDHPNTLNSQGVLAEISELCSGGSQPHEDIRPSKDSRPSKDTRPLKLSWRTFFSRSQRKRGKEM